MKPLIKSQESILLKNEAEIAKARSPDCNNYIEPSDQGLFIIGGSRSMSPVIIGFSNFQG